MKILILYPTPFEAGAFFKKYAGKKPSVGASHTVNLGDREIVAFVTGYGCPSTVERVKKIADEVKPDIAFICGFCGSCSSDIGKGDFLCETENEGLKKLFKGMGASPARIACVETFAGLEVKKELFKKGYEGVDMEGTLFREIFGAEKFGAFRSVSDELESKVPEYFFHLLIDMETGGDKPLAGALVKLLFKKPLDFLRLIQFANDTRVTKAHYDAKALALVDAVSKFNF